jgi:hypothetical protein
VNDAGRLAQNAEANGATHGRDHANLELMQRVFLNALSFHVPPLVRFFATFSLLANSGYSV